MNRIKVKNLGPIKEGLTEGNGFLDVKKVTVFIGNQGTGKSTVAKLISTCKWLEKAMNRGDVNTEIHFSDFIGYLSNQGISNYFSQDVSTIKYCGDAFSIRFSANEDWPFLKVETASKDEYQVPKVMYVPAERNFLSVIKNAFNVTGLLKALSMFAEEYKRAQRELNGEIVELPTNNFQYSYEDASDTSFVISGNNKIDLSEAASGLQSSIPLFLVSRNISSSITKDVDVRSINDSLSAIQNLRLNEEFRQLTRNSILSDVEKSKQVRKILAKYHNSCFINIVEEPEQNLFPDSQRHILNSLLGFANKQEANELLMTTHSPYIINYLSIAIQGKHLLDKINASPQKEELLQRLNEIVPIEACISADDVAIYQFQNDGSICRLENYEGIPSDKNYLNQSLAEGNQLFDALLELEEEL